MEGVVALAPVDAVEVTIVVDTYVDILMASEEGVRRLPTPPDLFEREQLIAEHGFAALVTVEREGARSSVLYDGGISRAGLIHNLDVIGIDPVELRAIVISHGHADHHGGLEGLFARLGHRPGSRS